VSGIYGRFLCRAKGHNFVQLMLRLAREREEVRVVDDEILTPTHTADIARQIRHMVEQGAEHGLYHVTAQGSCSWYRFCREIFKIRGINTPLHRAGPGEFAGGVQRPKYSVLHNGRLTAQGLDVMPDWKDGLREYLDELPSGV
jgi:dTDP-4-dehydrorhamnose reductase